MKTLLKNIIRYILCFGIIYFASCDAPHNNPLDPLNEKSGLSTINGIVQTISIPYQPIKDATVIWENFKIGVLSGTDGKFTLTNLKNNDGWLKIEKEGFVNDSLFIEWKGQTSKSVEIFLYTAPIIDSLIFYSIVEHRYPDKQDFGLVTKLKISDADNDIDSVFIVNPKLDFISALEYNLSSKFHEGSYTLFDLGITSLTEIIGKDFDLLVKDYAHRVFNLGSTNVKRIITDEVEIISPKNNDTLLTSPTLKWKRFTPGFEFKYLAQIYTFEIEPELVWQKEIAFSEIEYTLELQLLSDDYFWVISCIDEFQNRSRSKQGTFIIK